MPGMKRRRGAWQAASLLGACLLLGSSPHAFAADRIAVPPECAAPDEFTAPDEPLDHVAAALAAGGPLNVLAIGSATTVGEASSTAHGTPPGGSFPYRMADALRSALSNIPVQLTVHGGRGLTAEDMLPMLQAGLKDGKYQLVLWQTGTVEAVRGLRPEAMQAALQEGVETVHNAGADLVVIDSQFSRFLRANANLEPYETVLDQAATMPGVVLFHRFEVMRSWAHEGHIDLEKTPKAGREKAIGQLNTCLGITLARFVLNGAAEK